MSEQPQDSSPPPVDIDGWQQVAAEMDSWHPDLQEHAKRHLAQHGVSPSDSNLVEQQDSEPVGLSPEKQRLLDGATSLSTTITDTYPQVDEEGKLNYVIAGSLAVMLLSQASSFDTLDASTIPDITPTETIEIPAEVGKRLRQFARHAGDLDYVQTDHYRKKKDLVSEIDYEKEHEEYSRQRAKYLWKGGTDLPPIDDTAHDLLQLKEGQILFADVLGAHGDYQAARITIEGRDFYIADPRAIVGFKSVHLAESFEHSEKPEKYLGDLEVLIDAVDALYGHGTTVQSTHDVLFAYGSWLPNGLEIPYFRTAFNDGLRDFFDEVIAIDPDVSYLNGMHYGRERAIGILKILHQFETDAAKLAIVDALNRNRNEVDEWTFTPYSAHNRAVIVEHISDNTEFGQRFKENFKLTDDEEIEEWLRSSPYAMRYLEHAPDQEGLDKSPVASNYLDVVITLDEANLTTELGIVDQVIDRQIDQGVYRIKSLLRGEIMQTGLRGIVMEGLAYGLAYFDSEKMAQFLKEISTAASDYYKSGASLERIRDKERPALIRSVLEDFGVQSSNP